MANIIAWNVRGLNNPNKQEDIRIFLQKQEVGLVALLETKVKRENIEEVAKRLFGGWEWETNVAYNPKVRIWVAWRNRAYHLRVLEATDQLMHYKVHQVHTHKICYITFVYGMNTNALRQSLWGDLRRITGQMQMAWGVLGDFNATLYLEERLGRTYSLSRTP